MAYLCVHEKTCACLMTSQTCTENPVGRASMQKVCAVGVSSFIKQVAPKLTPVFNQTSAYLMPSHSCTKSPVEVSKSPTESAFSCSEHFRGRWPVSSSACHVTKITAEIKAAYRTFCKEQKTITWKKEVGSACT